MASQESTDVFIGADISSILGIEHGMNNNSSQVINDLFGLQLSDERLQNLSDMDRLAFVADARALAAAMFRDSFI
jgi:hypothetical protein